MHLLASVASRTFKGEPRRFALRRFPYRIVEPAQVVEIITIRHDAPSPEDA